MPGIADQHEGRRKAGLEQMQAFPEGSEEIHFEAKGQTDLYEWIARTLRERGLQKETSESETEAGAGIVRIDRPLFRKASNFRRPRLGQSPGTPPKIAGRLRRRLRLDGQKSSPIAIPSI